MMDVENELRELTMMNGEVIIQSIIGMDNEVEFLVSVWGKENKDASVERLANKRGPKLPLVIHDVLRELYANGSASTIPTVS